MKKPSFTHDPLVAASILSADFAHLAQELEKLESAGVDWIHLDVMDGHFVPNLTIGPLVIKSIRPYCTLPFSLHLMIETPERYLCDYKEAGADIITVHVETCRHLNSVLTQIKSLGLMAGVALNPATPLVMVEEVLDWIDLILVMSVNPGFGGQAFIPQTLDKLERLKQMTLNRSIFIAVDGGIQPDNAQDIRNAGGQVLVSGSAIFKHQEPMETIIQKLRLPGERHAEVPK